jgi:hypothetical protein
MTATPRLWQLDEDAEGTPGELVASMEDDSDGPFGARYYTLTLSEAIDREICAPYQVVCVDITDTQTPPPSSGSPRRRGGAGAWRSFRPRSWSTPPPGTCAPP